MSEILTKRIGNLWLKIRNSNIEIRNKFKIQRSNVPKRTVLNFEHSNLSKCARIPPSFAGGMNGLPSPLGERVRVRGN
jgi:hypothetical protein